jgi:hypothetical protein
MSKLVPKKNTMKTSFMLETDLHLLIVDRGLDMSATVNYFFRCLFDIPEDPTEKLIKKQIEYIVLQARNRLDRETDALVKQHATISNLEEGKRKQEEDLIQFGKNLQKIPEYDVLKNHLGNIENEDIDDDLLDRICSKMEKRTGISYEGIQLHNLAVDWWNKYGRNEP